MQTFLDSMDSGAWPFLVRGVICLVNSVNERDLSLLISLANVFLLSVRSAGSLVRCAGFLPASFAGSLGGLGRDSVIGVRNVGVLRFWSVPLRSSSGLAGELDCSSFSFSL